MRKTMTILTLFLSPAIHAEAQFIEQVIDDNVSIGYGIAVADVDGDSLPDILLADKKEFVWYRNGDWKRFVMASNLTEYDNVCVAARDINGDGMAEVAVGAQWNPSETTDTLQSGAVYFLVRPGDPTGRWQAIKMYHEPTVHRMRWVKSERNQFQLIVLPLHGRGNRNGEGANVRMIVYDVPTDSPQKWRYQVIDLALHLTHNFDVIPDAVSESILVGGKEGSIKLLYDSKTKHWLKEVLKTQSSFGEIRAFGENGKIAIAGIQPMHGNELAVYENSHKTILAANLQQGHALAVAKISPGDDPQIIAGWRERNQDNEMGIKLFFREGAEWKNQWIDRNGMACEDIQVEDLDGDGKKDVIASGRSTHNLKIYWNKNQ